MIKRVRALHLTGVLPPRWPTFALVTDRKSLLPGRPPGAQLTCVAPVKWRPQMPVMQVIEAQLRLERGPQRRANSVRLLGQRATGPRFTAAVPVRRRRSTSAGLRRTTFAPVPPPTADRICRRFSRTVHGLVVSRSSMRNGRGSIVAVCASATASAARSAGPTGATLPAAPVSIGRLRCGRLPRLLEGLCANTPT